ncbi:MAG: type II toxin-antitoxin system Phd/YefM family antitoxin [Treponema sp.]|nr:type II toxin-antitoxin system Phd/YefM family antitoxin [Treponema sp.]
MAIFLTDSYFSCDNSLVREKSLMNAVPIFEAKNRLPFFIHKAETEGPVAISRRNKEVAYIISKEDYEKKMAAPKKSLADRIHDSRAEYGLTDDDDFDFSEHLEKIRREEWFRFENREREEAGHIFDWEDE